MPRSTRPYIPDPRQLTSMWPVVAVNNDTSQITGQLQELHVDSRPDSNMISNDIGVIGSIPFPISFMQNERAFEERLIDRLKEMIIEFIHRHDRRFSYEANMRWYIDHCNHIRFNVVITVKRP